MSDEQKTLRQKLQDYSLQGLVYLAGAVVLWAATVGPRLEAKLENETWKRETAATNAHNATVAREAKFLTDLENMFETKLAEMQRTFDEKLAERDAKIKALTVVPEIPLPSIFSTKQRPYLGMKDESLTATQSANTSFTSGEVPRMNVQQSPNMRASEFKEKYTKEFKKE
jgi:hypothetical protein